MNTNPMIELIAEATERSLDQMLKLTQGGRAWDSA
jgi:hypothetical protein